MQTEGCENTKKINYPLITFLYYFHLIHNETGIAFIVLFCMPSLRLFTLFDFWCKSWFFYNKNGAYWPIS